MAKSRNKNLFRFFSRGFTVGLMLWCALASDPRKASAQSAIVDALPTGCSMIFSQAGKATVSLNQILTHLNFLIERHHQILELEVHNRPQWDSYNEAAKLLQILEASQSRTATGAVPLSSDAKASLDVHSAKVQPRWAEVISRYKKDDLNRKKYFRYLDYHMAYFKKLQRINELLGLDLFPSEDLAQIPKDSELTAVAKEMVARNMQYFENVLPHFGYENLDALRSYARNYNEDSGRVLDVVENGLVLAIHRPSRARFWIEHAGFQNQRVTNTSLGGLVYTDSSVDGSTMNNLDFDEARLMREDPSEYAMKSARLKPNYGEYIVNPELKIHDARIKYEADRYGDDLWILKKSIVEERATWTPTDSINSKTHHFTDNKDHIFFPWETRVLMTPYALHSMRKGNFSSSMQIDPGFQWNAETWETKYSAQIFFEAQVWGPLTIHDVDAFIFREVVPDRATYELFVNLGIKVWDGRSLPPKRYYGEESNSK